MSLKVIEHIRWEPFQPCKHSTRHPGRPAAADVVVAWTRAQRHKHALMSIQPTAEVVADLGWKAGEQLTFDVDRASGAIRVRPPVTDTERTWTLVKRTGSTKTVRFQIQASDPRVTVGFPAQDAEHIVTGGMLILTGVTFPPEPTTTTKE